MCSHGSWGATIRASSVMGQELTSEAVEPGRSRGSSRLPSSGLRRGGSSRCSEPRRACEWSVLAPCRREGRRMGDRSCCSLEAKLRRGVPPAPRLSSAWTALASSGCTRPAWTSTLLEVSRSLSSVKKLLTSDRLPSSELPGPSCTPRSQGGTAGRVSLLGSGPHGVLAAATWRERPRISTLPFPHNEGRLERRAYRS